MIVLGIDPSLCNLGIAAVELRPSTERVVETLVIRTQPSDKKRKLLAAEDQARRIGELVAGLEAAVVRHRPIALIVEAPAGSKGAKAARALGLSFGAVIAVAALHRLPLVQVQPLDVKRAVCGRKRADKDEIIEAIERRHPEVSWPSPASVIEHAADAVGAALAGMPAPEIVMARRLGVAPEAA